MAIVRKDKMLAGYNGNLESVIVHSSTNLNSTLEITNGVFVKVGNLMAGEREVKQAILATTADAQEDILFIHNSEVMYDSKKYKLADFRIARGKVARAYRLYNGDIITLTTDLFEGAVSVGDVLVAHTAGKLGKDDVVSADAKVKFLVIENAGRELDPEMDAFAVQVIRA